MKAGGIVVVADPEAVAREAASRFAAAAVEAVRARGRFTVVLSGGSTPRGLYSVLAGPEYRERVPWSRTIVLFGDERCVGPDHPESNYRMASQALLDHVPVPHEQVHRMVGESRPAEAATLYEATLKGLFPGEPRPRLDLVLLGVGSDGHTASLFPGTAALGETSRWVAANHVPKLGAWRITLTFPALAGGRRILFLVTGSDKAPVLAEAFGGAPHAEPHPCERALPADGTREILIDRAAAARLPGGV